MVMALGKPIKSAIVLELALLDIASSSSTSTCLSIKAGKCDLIACGLSSEPALALSWLETCSPGSRPQTWAPLAQGQLQVAGQVIAGAARHVLPPLVAPKPPKPLLGPRKAPVYYPLLNILPRAPTCPLRWMRPRTKTRLWRCACGT